MNQSLLSSVWDSCPFVSIRGSTAALWIIRAHSVQATVKSGLKRPGKFRKIGSKRWGRLTALFRGEAIRIRPLHASDLFVGEFSKLLPLVFGQFPAGGIEPLQ
jgi:hypothetical protein